MHNDFQFDVRQRLGFMRDNPTDCAIGREAFLAQVTTWLLVAGIDPADVERMFYPEKLCDMAARLALPLEVDWLRRVIDKALAALPDPCVVNITRELTPAEKKTADTTFILRVRQPGTSRRSLYRQLWGRLDGWDVESFDIELGGHDEDEEDVRHEDPGHQRGT